MEGSLLARFRSTSAKHFYDSMELVFRILSSGRWIKKHPLVIPEPPFDDITGVLLTYYRSRQCRQVVKEFMNCGMQTIVLANDGSPKPGWANDSVTWLQSSKNLGLDCRFVVSQLARTKYVIGTDDDLLIPRETIKRLALEAESKEGLVGLFGRNPTQHREYNADQTFDAEMVLSGGCLFRTELLPLFFEAKTSEIFRKARREVATLKKTHCENGEDLLFSYAVKRRFGRAGFVFNLPSIQLRRGHKALYGSADHMLARTIMLRAGQEYAMQK